MTVPSINKVSFWTIKLIILDNQPLYTNYIYSDKYRFTIRLFNENRILVKLLTKSPEI